MRRAGGWPVLLLALGCDREPSEFLTAGFGRETETTEERLSALVLYIAVASPSPRPPLSRLAAFRNFSVHVAS